MATAASPPGPAVDAKAYYGYLFQDDKAPTPVFNALLQSLAQYVVSICAFALLRLERRRD